MGCCSVNLVKEDINIRQQKINLNLNTKFHRKELIRAQSLINLISRIRNKIIFLYHKLIYDTGACLFLNPTIVHCFQTILYKISSEFEGKLENFNIEYIEDPPYLKIEKESLTEESLNLINELFSFIIELKSYKTIIKQIDKETPSLLYLISENKENISLENINNINKGIELFQDLIKIREDILNLYKYQVRELITRKDSYCEEINKIGEEAFQKNINDIYEITLLKNNNLNVDKDYQMYKSIKEAKKNIKKIIEQEFNDDIINSHESIIEAQKEEL